MKIVRILAFFLFILFAFTLTILLIGNKQVKAAPDGEISGDNTSSQSLNFLNEQVDNSFLSTNDANESLNQDAGSNLASTKSSGIGVSATINIAGACKKINRSSNCADAEVVKVAINAVLQAESGTTATGAYTINTVTLNSGDVVTVFIDNVADDYEAVAVTKYDGTGDIANLNLYERHLHIGSDDNQTITNTNLAQYDNSVSSDEDIFIEVDDNNDLTIPALGTSTFSDQVLYIRALNTFQPDSGNSGNVTVPVLVNPTNATLTVDANDFNASTSTTTNGTVNVGASANTGFSTGDYTQSSGSLVCSGTSKINISGNWYNFGSSFTRSDSTLTLSGSGKTFTSTYDFYPHNLNITGSISVPTKRITFNDASTILNVSGSLTLNETPVIMFVTTSSVVLSGTITSTGTNTGLVIYATGQLPGTGTLNSKVKFQVNSQIIPARAYGGDVVFNGNGRVFTLAAGIHSYTNIYVEAPSPFTGNTTLTGATNNPTVNVSGLIDYIGTGVTAYHEIIEAGNGTWTVGGSIDFTHGTFTSGGSTFILNGSGAQTITANTQSFNNLTVTNASVAGVTFADNGSATGTFTDVTASSKLTFHATSTYAFANISISGQATGTRIVMVSSDPSNPDLPSRQWLFNIAAASPVASYVNVTDSDALGGHQINATTGGLDSGNNENWSFPISASISGSCKQFDQSTNCADAETIKVAVNDELQAQTGATSGGAYTINSVLVSSGVVITVFVDNVADDYEAVAITKYDGAGNVSNLNLFERHLYLGSDDNQVLVNLDIARYDNSVSSDEDIFIEVDASNNLTVPAAATSSFSDQEIYIAADNTYLPSIENSGDVITPSLEIAATGMLDTEGNTITLTGAGTPFVKTGDFEISTSVFIYTGEGATTITAGDYYDLTFAPAASSPTYTLAAGTFSISDELIIGDGSHAVVADLDANDPDLSVASAFSIEATATFVASASADLILYDNYTNDGIFTDSLGTLTLAGLSGQIIICGGTDADHNFNDLTITNASIPGVTFSDSCTVSDTFTDTTASSKLTFTAGETYAFVNIDINGQATDTRIQMLSSDTAVWLFNISSDSPQVSFVDVEYSDASGGNEIDDTMGGYDSGNNTHWLFPAAGADPVNNSLTLTNPYSGNTLVSDDNTGWTFRALVTDTDGANTFDHIELRLANNTDSVQPYNSLVFRWSQPSDSFSEIADTQNTATILSVAADSSVNGNQWTIDFKIKFNGNFDTVDTQYAAELESVDYSAASDTDNYADIYQITPLVLELALDSGTVDFGDLLQQASTTATTVVTVDTNYYNGYSLFVNDNITGADSALLHTDLTTHIPDYDGTVDIPTVWSGDGLGICLFDATDKEVKWGAGATEADVLNRYAGIPEDAIAIHTKNGNPTVSDENYIGYKLTAPADQETGDYSGTIIIFSLTGVLE